MRTKLDCVLDALRRGLFVSACLPKTKVPATPHGFKDRTRNEGVARAMWAKCPDGNIACNAGVVFDIDNQKTIEDALAFARKCGVPDTLGVHTGRRDGNYGLQLHFTGDALHSGPYEIDGVRGEIRGMARNLYGFWAGSVHPDSGEKYEIVVDLPVAAWPAAIVLGNARREFPRFSASDELETTVYRAQQTFERLLREAKRAKQGRRNAAAHSLCWFSARAFLAEVFEIGFDESHPALSKQELAELIGETVRPLYAPGERDVTKMLNDSWGYGIAAGRLKLDIYWSDLDRVFAIENSERIDRLLDGNVSDFPSAIAARDHLVSLLNQAGFDEEGRKRVLRYTHIDDAVAEEAQHVLEIAELLGDKL